MATFIEERKKNSPLIQIQTKQPPTRISNGHQIGTNTTLEIDVESLIAELKNNHRKAKCVLMPEAVRFTQRTHRITGRFRLVWSCRKRKTT